MSHKNGDTLQMHIIKEHQQTENKCDICEKVFSYHQNLEYHRTTQQQHHAGRRHSEAKRISAPNLENYSSEFQLNFEHSLFKWEFF